MQLLRHFTIRRVVLWMMLLSLTAVAQAGSYGAMTLREMYRLADSGDATMNEVLHGLGGVNALIG
jgi:methyl-accepting chemotaxis protein